MADVETPRSARRRRISEDIGHAGSDLAEGVLDSMVSRHPGPAGKLRALLERLDMVSVEPILSLAEGEAHPDNGDLDAEAPAAVATDLADRVADLPDSTADKADLVAFTGTPGFKKQVTALVKAIRAVHASLDEASNAAAARHSLRAFPTPPAGPSPAPSSPSGWSTHCDQRVQLPAGAAAATSRRAPPPSRGATSVGETMAIRPRGIRPASRCTGRRGPTCSPCTTAAMWLAARAGTSTISVVIEAPPPSSGAAGRTSAVRPAGVRPATRCTGRREPTRGPCPIAA